MTNTPQGNQSGGGDWTAQNLGSTAASGNTEPAEQTPRPDSGEPAPGSDRYGRDETARNPNMDPDPEQAQGPTDLEPGETPPESNSATATPPTPPPSKPPKSNLIITVAVIAGVVLVGLIFFGYIAGLLD